MRSALLIVVLLFTLALPAHAVTGYPQEKIQLFTNGSRFVTGDTVRFRAFVQDAASGSETKKLSQFIYVELIDPFGTVHSRIKVRNLDGVFAGVMPLDRELPESRYTLAAYTTYMQNQGQEYFSRTPIEVSSIYAYKYRITSEINGRKLSVRLTERSTGKPVGSESLVLCGPDGVIADAGRKKSAHRFTIPPEIGTVKVTFDNYSKFIAIPYDPSSIGVEFFPEGGALIPGVSNTLAFRATDPDGRPAEISGEVVDADGNHVAPLATDPNGIGRINFLPVAPAAYSAVINGRTYPLPAPDPDAAALQVVATRSHHFIVDVIGRKPATTILAAHVRGDIQLLDTIDAFPVTVPKSSLSAGPVRFMLLDAQGREISARTAYNFDRSASALTAADIPSGSYVLFAGADSTSAAMSPQAAMLRADLNGYIPDLDRYFSNPDSIGLRAETDALMLAACSSRYDADVARLLSGRLVEPTYPIEIGGVISGVIKSRWRGKPMADACINIIAPTLGLANAAQTDSTGRFTVTGIDWPDGTHFICQAFNKSGKREHNFEIATDSFPTVTPLPMPLTRPDHVPASIDQLERSGIMLREIQVTTPRTNEENTAMLQASMGIRTFDSNTLQERHITSYEEIIRTIPGLKIEGGRLISTRSNSIFGGPAPVEIWVNGVKWASSVINEINPKLDKTLVTRKDIRMFRSGRGAPQNIAESAVKYSDKGMSEIDELTGNYPVDVIETIQYVPSYAALAVSNTAAHGGGALIITTKTGKNGSDNSLFIQTHSPLGYQDEKSAYQECHTPNGNWTPDASDVRNDETRPVTVFGFTDSGQLISTLLP